MGFLLLIAFLCLAVLCIPATLSYFIYKKISNKRYGRLVIVITCILYGFIFYNIYTAIYPTDDFYYGEFKEVTQREIPKSANIIRKEASYPDVHGDYISCSLIKLSKTDYSKLLSQINNDNRLTNQKEIIWSEELESVLGYKNKSSIKNGFTKKTEGGGYNQLYIGFLNDNETIVVYVCYT